MAKLRFWDILNIKRSLKGIGSDLVTWLTVLVPGSLTGFLYRSNYYVLSSIMAGVTLVIYLYAKGYWYKKFWSWK